MPHDSSRELFLIDGSSLVYRAFFALPESISTSKGQPTNAIFGFASMLVKIVSEYGVKPTIVVWDAGKSGREETYPEYKANRTSRPDLLREQWPYMEPLVDSFGYANLHVDGYEADDVIASAAGRAREQGLDVMVVTGDRDLFQLIEPGVRVMATSRGITETKVYDHDAVVDRYGIPPALVPDFVGLKGDTSDNIPGVPGIGDKTATQLLQEYGDLEGVLANVDSISGAKRKQNLTEHADDARISKQLATAIRDLEVSLDFEALIGREPDRSRLRETFREFELRAPLERLEEALGEDERGAGGAGRRAARGARPDGVDRRAGGAGGGAGDDRGRAGRGRRRRKPCRRMPDRPTRSRTRPRSWPRRRTRRWRRRSPTSPEDAGAAAAARNGGSTAAAVPGVGVQGTLDFDAADLGPLHVAAFAGEDVLSAEAETLRDFTDARGAAAAGRPRLEDDRDRRRRACRRAGAGARHDGRRLPDRPRPARLPARGAGDRDRPGREARRGRSGGRGRARGAHAHDRRASAGAARGGRPDAAAARGRAAARRRAGRRWSAPGSSSTSSGCARSAPASAARRTQLERTVWELAGEEFMIGSPQQLAPILFDKLGLSKKRRGKTGFSTDARVLQAIRSEHEIVPAIEEWRELTKLKSTYLDAFPALIDADGRLRTTFSQVTAATGRLSSTNPNLQNIPIRTERGREIRACFVAEPGCKLISADYSQVELRLLAHIAGEDVLKADLPPRRGRAHRHRRADPRRRSRSGHALEGEDGQLRDRLRPVGVRARRSPADPARGGAGVHRRLPRALPGGAAPSSRRRSSRRPRTAT